MESRPHKAGYVSIIGKPNVGKSTLMNAMVGERLSIITSKAQTTRHRIMGILSGDDFQIIYSDTPGIIKPEYELHETMMRFVTSSFEDSDLILFVTDLYEKYEGEKVIDYLKEVKVPVILVMNKIDLAKGSQAEDKVAYWKELMDFHDIVMVSALENIGIEGVFEKIIEHLPEHPAYFPKDTLTDKPERFFVDEMIREKIFKQYKKEIPYSCEVVTTSFKEDENIIRISADIYVERDSQKGIVIGHKGESLKKVGTAAREDLEIFFGKKIFLETHVKVEKDWRKKEAKLKRFGYLN
ncbi:GTP-binding protein Era [Roseivirga ehrenbergii]|uniref:GTPase Era n=2 Tax=Roseivirga TaxID=290180 RepID=A0A150XK55_ROSEK|nr:MULTISPECIES: GTPase Era [Roseivirga]KYG79090.1 GTPase Era [Roseivirga ehrenbergii]KYG79380.1 GTPase Era [Roseivirga seohaensis]TCK99113.1 GTP-binding protein Era [Roseivirga ehrenbergii]